MPRHARMTGSRVKAERLGENGEYPPVPTHSNIKIGHSSCHLHRSRSSRAHFDSTSTSTILSLSSQSSAHSAWLRILRWYIHISHGQNIARRGFHSDWTVLCLSRTLLRCFTLNLLQHQALPRKTACSDGHPHRQTRSRETNRHTHTHARTQTRIRKPRVTHAGM